MIDIVRDATTSTFHLQRPINLKILFCFYRKQIIDCKTFTLCQLDRRIHTFTVISLQTSFSVTIVLLKPVFRSSINVTIISSNSAFSYSLAYTSKLTEWCLIEKSARQMFVLLMHELCTKWRVTDNLHCWLNFLHSGNNHFPKFLF